MLVYICSYHLAEPCGGNLVSVLCLSQTQSALKKNKPTYQAIGKLFALSSLYFVVPGTRQNLAIVFNRTILPVQQF